MGLKTILRENKLPKVLIVSFALYFVLMLIVAKVMMKSPDEGTHSLLSVFYIDFFKFAVSNPSFSQAYDYAYSYLIDFPKLSVYYPPLTHLMISFLFLILGRGIFIARLVPAVLSILFAGLTYYFSNYLTGNRETSIMTSILYISLPIVLFLSTSVLLEIGMSFFFTLTMFLFLVGLKSKERKYFILAGAAAALGFFCKWQLVLAMPILLIYSIMFRKKDLKLNLKNFFIFALAFSIIVAPYVLIMIRLDLFFVTFTSPVGAIGRYEGMPRFWNIESWIFYPIKVSARYFVFPFSLITLLGLFYCVRKSLKGGDNERLLFRMMIVWILIIYVFFSILPNRQERFILPMVFPLCFLTALYSRKLIKRFGIVAKVILIVLISINFLTPFIPIVPVTGDVMVRVAETADEEIGDFLIENPQTYYVASETPYFYPSNLMFNLAASNARVKGVRTCALTAINETEWDSALQEYGVKWIFYDLGNIGATDRPDTRFVIETLQENGLINKVDTIKNVEVYEYVNYNEFPVEECNYICLIQEKICE